MYGLQWYSSYVDYFICQDEGLPHFIPSYFYEVLDPRLPPDWAICVTYAHNEYRPLFDRYGVTSLVGYKEFVTLQEHYDGVICGEEDALPIFFMKKKKWIHGKRT